MKQQLKDMHQIVRLVDPELMSYLEARDSANFYFCFRWLLVRFKRELNYASTLRLWEVLWTGHPCTNFHLLVAVALLDTEKDTIMENKFGFTEILKHINDISLRIDIDATLKKAEAIYLQVQSSPRVPDPVRTVLSLPPQEPQASPQQDGCIESSDGGEGTPGSSGEDVTHAGDVVETLSGLGIVGVVSSMIGLAVRHISGDDDMTDAQLEVPPQDRREEERQEGRFETALSHQFV